MNKGRGGGLRDSDSEPPTFLPSGLIRVCFLTLRAEGSGVAAAPPVTALLIDSFLALASFSLLSLNHSLWLPSYDKHREKPMTCSIEMGRDPGLTPRALKTHPLVEMDLDRSV